MNAQPVRRCRILILDDEPIIALDIESILLDAGYEIANVTGRIATALAVIESGACDAAVLDANLSGESAAPVAAALLARGLPFIVLSGYAKEQLPEIMRAAPCLEKPTNATLLVDRLRSIVDPHRA